MLLKKITFSLLFLICSSLLVISCNQKPNLVKSNSPDEIINDSSYTLTWNPGGGEIATSDNLGYTYGIYKLATKDTIFRGTYVSIWKKQKDGKWKFVLDSGNPGIGR